MSACENCGRDATPRPEQTIDQPSGWCAPSEALYEMPVLVLCMDCKTRMLMASELGIDPGRDGVNLRVQRGGIKYGSL